MRNEVTGRLFLEEDLLLCEKAQAHLFFFNFSTLSIRQLRNFRFTEDLLCSPRISFSYLTLQGVYITA